jgi:hypothetical protein
MPNATPTAQAAYLRKRINALGLDLAHCSTPGERREVKIEIRAAEIALTELAVAS